MFQQYGSDVSESECSSLGEFCQCLTNARMKCRLVKIAIDTLMNQQKLEVPRNGGNKCIKY